jgi:hypothetical protein
LEELKLQKSNRSWIHCQEHCQLLNANFSMRAASLKIIFYRLYSLQDPLFQGWCQLLWIKFLQHLLFSCPRMRALGFLSITLKFPKLTTSTFLENIELISSDCF